MRVYGESSQIMLDVLRFLVVLFLFAVLKQCQIGCEDDYEW